MAPIRNLLIAALVLVLGEAGLEWGKVAPWAVILLLPLPHLLILSGRNLSGGGSLRLGLMVSALGRGAGPLAYGLLVLGAGWITFLRRATGAALSLDGWPEPELFYAVLPWLAFEVLTLDARSRAECAPGRERLRWRAFHLRGLLAVLLPLLLYFGATVLVGHSPWLRASIEQVELGSALFLALLLLLLVLLLPSLLRLAWRTRPLEDSVLLERFRAIAARAGFQARSVRVWETGNLVANAAIIGLLPGQRDVLLSDSILRELDREELSAVYAHELGHSRCHHVPTFLAFALAMMVLGQLLGVVLEPAIPAAEILVPLVVLALWFFVFGWLSRRFELQADLFAQRLVGGGAPLVRALAKLRGNLRDVGSWRHFSAERRAAFLARSAEDPYWAWRFERKLGRLSALGYLLCFVALSLESVRVFGALPEDRAWAALAMGEYDLARDRAAEARDRDGHLARLLERVASARDRSANGLLEQALEALLVGDTQATKEWTELAALRGDRAARQVARVLELVEENDPESALRALWLAPQSWQAALAPSLAGTRAEQGPQ